MRKIYLNGAISSSSNSIKILGDRFTLDIADAGLHALAWFRSAKDLPLLLRARPTLGVKISPLAAFCIDASLPPALLLGFAAWSPAQIREGLITLARALDERPVHINHKALRNNRGKSRSV
jgi:DNA-binding transcriptional MocR family regulator